MRKNKINCKRVNQDVQDHLSFNFSSSDEDEFISNISCQIANLPKKVSPFNLKQEIIENVNESTSSEDSLSGNDLLSCLTHSNLLCQNLNKQKYNDLQNELNSEEYLNLTISRIRSSSEISQFQWKSFEEAISNDDCLIDKNIKKSYSSKFLECKLISNNELLLERLSSLELGFLLIGNVVCDIDYEVDDKINFIVVHHFESLDLSNQIKDFFSVSNVLILEPDYVLFPTLIALSNNCYRAPLVKMKFSMTNTMNWQMLKGNILHDVFEQLMELHQQGAFTKSEIDSTDIFNKIIQDLYTKYIEDLFLLDKKIKEFETEIQPITRNMIIFVSKYLIKGEIYLTKQNKRRIRIIRLVENELSVTNQIIGLKGQIDCLFLCEVEETMGSEAKYKCVIPFELKTGGKKKHLYEDQSLFYCLLISQKQRNNNNLEGFLYYLSFNEIISLSPTRSRTFGLISRRNKLAKMIKNMETKGIMKEINSNRPDICKFCYEKEACYSSQIAEDLDILIDLEDVANSYKLDNEFTDFHSLFDAMTEGSKRYLQHWLSLIQKEQQFDHSQIKKKFERFGSRNVEIDQQFFAINFNVYFQTKLYYSLSNEEQDIQQQQQDLSNLKQQEPKEILYLGKYFKDLESMIGANEFFREGDSYIISQLDIKITYKAILLERTSNQEAEQITLVLKFKEISPLLTFDQKKVSLIITQNRGTNLLWDIKLFTKDHYPDQRQNVINLILNQVANVSEKHKHLIQTYSLKQFNEELINAIIKNNPPTFNVNDQDIETILSQFPCLIRNTDQANSIRKVLRSNSLTCVLGMPGTGKTFLIAHLIKILTSQKKIVLITSYTNSALDNIILKLFELFPEIEPLCMRRGSNKNLIHPIAQRILYDPKSFKQQPEFVEYFSKKLVFFSTIIGSNNKLFHSDKIYFDFCIIDEASQCVEPLCLGPMLQCRKTVLIGDHYQLQPLVKNEEAGKLGLSFRMNNSIMEIPNIMVYSGKLKAFDERIGSRIIQLSGNWIKGTSATFVQKAINPINSVIFLDSQNVENILLELPVESLHKLRNVSVDLETSTQILTITCLLKYLLQICRINQRSIACITSYNTHRIQLSNLILNSFLSSSGIEVYTIDKSQGIDKDIVILHCSNKIGAEHLMTNWRRTNVAVTRAKMKLIIIGNSLQLSQEKTLGELIRILYQKQYVHTLDRNDITHVLSSNSSDNQFPQKY